MGSMVNQHVGPRPGLRLWQANSLVVASRPVVLSSCPSLRLQHSRGIADMKPLQSVPIEAGPVPSDEAMDPSTPPAPWASAKALQCLTPEEQEKERERRARISAANTGKQPWNKGKKHSPETIAKIRERTKAAMQRPEVVQAYKQGVAKHLQKRAEEKALHPEPEKPPKQTTRRRKEAAEGEGQAEGEPVKRTRRSRKTAASAEGGEGEGEGEAGPRRRRRSKTDSSEQGEGDVPKERKRRQPPSEEHRAAIAAAIKAKWQDPDYRQRALKGIHAYVTERAGSVNPGGKPRTKSSSSGRSSSNGSSSKSQTKAAERKARQAKLSQVEELVAQVVNCRKLIVRMELNMEGTKAKASAFLNDPRMAGRAAAVISESEQAMEVAKTKLAQLEAQIPPGVVFDMRGKITSVNPDLLFGSDAPDTEPDSTHSTPSSGAALAGGSPAVVAAAGISDLDPPVMQKPQENLPDLTLMNGQVKVNGPHSNHVNGVHHVNGHSQLHVNGHGHAVGAAAAASIATHLTSPPSAIELLTPRAESPPAQGTLVDNNTVIELLPPPAVPAAATTAAPQGQQAEQVQGLTSTDVAMSSTEAVQQQQQGSGQQHVDQVDSHEPEAALSWGLEAGEGVGMRAGTSSGQHAVELQEVPGGVSPSHHDELPWH